MLTVAYIMAKVITFSQKFPSYHPKAGQPTYFVEAFYKSLFVMKCLPKELEESFNHEVFLNGMTKHHTVRSGNRFKKGDFFSPRVWGTDVNPKSGKSGAYHSKQIILSHDTEIKNVWDIEINEATEISINGKFISYGWEVELANNDGLSWQEFNDWFVKLPFKGQIICWNDAVYY
mgnify:FL=1